MSLNKKDEQTSVVLQEVLVLLGEIKKDQSELATELNSEQDRHKRFLKNLIPWAGLYSLPMPVQVTAFFDLLGWGERLVAASRSDDKIAAQMAICMAAFEEELDESTQNRIDSFEDAELAVFLVVLFAMTNNASGIQKYGEPVSDLVSKAADDHESLFKAVAVDRSVVAHPVVARQISLAHLRRDEAFMNQLARAITQTKPRRKIELDEFRYMVEVLDEVSGLSSYTHSELAEILVNDLGVYSESPGGDASENIKKYLHQRQKRKGN